jgi:hypothetical protein
VPLFESGNVRIFEKSEALLESEILPKRMMNKASMLIERLRLVCEISNDQERVLVSLIEQDADHCSLPVIFLKEMINTVQKLDEKNMALRDENQKMNIIMQTINFSLQDMKQPTIPNVKSRQCAKTTS